MECPFSNIEFPWTRRSNTVLTPLQEPQMDSEGPVCGSWWGYMCTHTHTRRWSGHPLCKLFLPVCLACRRRRTRASERQSPHPFPLVEEQQVRGFGPLCWVHVLLRAGEERRGGGRPTVQADGTFLIITQWSGGESFKLRKLQRRLHSVRFGGVWHLLTGGNSQVVSPGLMSVLLWSLSFPLSCSHLRSDRMCTCPVWACVCPHVHLYLRFCLHNACVCVTPLSPSRPLPVLYHTLLPFSLFGRGVCSRSSQEVFVTRRAEGEGEQWDAQTQEVLFSSLGLQLGVFLSLSVSSVSLTLRVPSALHTRR